MEKQKYGMVLPIILLSYFMIILDNSIIFTSTVKIAADLNLDPQALSWVSNAYALTFGGFLLLGGRAGDLFGRKRLFLIGLVVFSLGSLLVGISTGATMIVTTRALQGLGSAILAPATLALLMDSYTGPLRMRAIAAYGATAGIGSSFGLVIGGLIASWFSWRDGFFLNVPVGILLFILAVRYIKVTTRPAVGKIDYLGTVTSVVGFSALVYSIVGEQYQLLAAIVAVIFLVSFVLTEAKIKAPIMPLKIFADRERSSAYVARFFFMGAMLAYWFLTPQVLQQLYHFSPLQAGIAFLPMSIVQFIAALQVSRLTTKWGNSRLLIVGLSTTLLGVLLAVVIGIHAGYTWAVALPMVLLGLGQGVTLSPLTVSGLANTDREIAGSASGVVNTIHQIGGSVGLSLVVALTSQISNAANSYHAALLIIASYLVVALLAASNILFQKN
ncbi:MFS transporter [Lactiplantibacillus pentosus]|uniref:MFS transporter n=1 Tax=Lactiplantibacillus pentosus TaxID=1589 RepID=A0ABD7IS52_LACPE|nr:MFS transporter [Lactiplantibacillus pentosus]MCJ8185978.1 MFS transporter [Lactiplantibacillus pentosus]MCT3303975.1 MFS transporter [Lactiplantibacillus pentosus]PRO77956.1 MFS transporter [Lactiplantibacillus pentosus]PRO82104.1 MFS transporter [Lactiplantibacillus pentosus]RMW50231.1 MFS transporter [Lactiplantibacillus pentosus]